MADTRHQQGEGVLERTRDEVKEPPLFKVVLLNDDYTTMDFVVVILEDVFHKTPAEAYRIMMQVHTQGKGLCGMYPFEVAETKVVDGPRSRAARTDFRCERASRRPDSLSEQGWWKAWTDMFSTSVELLLSVAYREATSRHHTHLTLEHLLYVLAHDTEGERILAACGADLPHLRRALDRYLHEKIETFTRGDEREPDQTLAFRRTLQTAVLHVQSAGREVQAGDLLAAMLQQTKSYAAQLLDSQGVTRLDVLNFITHGIMKVPLPLTPNEPEQSDTRTLGEEPASSTARDPIGAYAVNLTAQGDGRRARSADRPRRRAAADDGDPVPAAEEQSRVRRRSGRGQDGARRRPRAEAAAAGRADDPARRRGVLARRDRAASPARASGVISRSASRR